jgi:hypothetical protein
MLLHFIRTKFCPQHPNTVLSQLFSNVFNLCYFIFITLTRSTQHLVFELLQSMLLHFHTLKRSTQHLVLVLLQSVLLHFHYAQTFYSAPCSWTTSICVTSFPFNSSILLDALFSDNFNQSEIRTLIPYRNLCLQRIIFWYYIKIRKGKLTINLLQPFPITDYLNHELLTEE